MQQKDYKKATTSPHSLSQKQDLISKYNVPAPRYTSYPTVPFWDSETWTEEKWIERIKMAYEQSSALALRRSTDLSNSGSSCEYVIRYKGKYDDDKEYGDIVIKALGNGQFLRLKDVAKIQLDALSYAGVGE